MVFDNDDKIKLTRIFERVTDKRERPQIINCKYNSRPIEDNADFNSNCVKHPRYPTCYDAIVSSEAMVMRQLVEWQHIHVILMMPNMETALKEIQDLVSACFLIFCFIVNRIL